MGPKTISADPEIFQGKGGIIFYRIYTHIEYILYSLYTHVLNANRVYT